MQLTKLLKGVNYKQIIGESNIFINELQLDSKKVGLDDLFFCLVGNVDGHNYATEAKIHGAKCIVCQKELNLEGITQVIVDDTRATMSIMASNYYNNPSQKLKMVAVVGTNGKTTTTYLICEMLKKAKIKCGVIGTLGIKYLNKNIESSFTTPDPIELHRNLSEMVKNGVKVVVMEVSAHAIALKKVYGINYEVGVFTNVSQDHLDYFKNMEEYKRVKKSFFSSNVKYKVFNSDDSVGLELSREYEGSITYGIKNPADVFAIDIKSGLLGTKFVINLFDKVYKLKTKLIGQFNIYNLMASSVASAILGVNTNLIADVIEETSGALGRLEKIGSKNGGEIYVDYAHTPDGLKKVLESLKEVVEGRLLLVFGCGGNRDKTKRSLMGEIAGELANFTIITSDNPRYEEPMGIIKDIELGIVKSTDNYVIIEKRQDAINYAINHLKKGDLLLIAGKGAETYQEVLGVKHFFSDKEVVEKIVNS